MKKIKKLSAIASLLVFLLMMSPLSYSSVIAAEAGVKTGTGNNNQTVRLQDDFYDAINSDWINNTKIQEGKSTSSTFDDIEDKVTNQTKDIINELVINKDRYNNDSNEKKVINLYNNILNVEARNKDGLKPVQEILEQIKAAQTINDIIKLWGNKKIVNSTITFNVNRDIKNTNTNILYIGTTALSLGDADEYIYPEESTAKNKELTEDYYNKILMLSGYTKEEAKLKVDNMFKFEEMIAPYIMGKKEKLRTSNLMETIYNVYTLDELNKWAPNVDLPSIMNALGVDKANKIILQDPKWLAGLNKIYTQENLPLIKNYTEIVNLIYASNYLTEDFEKANKEYENAMFGITGAVSKDDDAINIVNSTMGIAIGKDYAEKYVPKKTKEDVENITRKIIDTYKKRISSLGWMSEETKKNAIDKLDKLDIKIGYPDNWIDYSKLDIKSYEEGGSFFQNIMTLRIFSNDMKYRKINRKPDKTRDVYKPQTVNAFYDVNENSIIIPGGIIQGDLYDPNGTIEKNLGGIGAIVAHEISHAFDNTGAQYDSDGNRKNWWNQSDYQQFAEKAKKIADFYSKIEGVPGEKINGYATLGENIADIGGMSCLIDILGTMDKPDYKTFFKNYAIVWRQVTTKEYQEYALIADVHSPNKFRVNAVLSQFQKFYDIYGIIDTDGMYVKPEDRLGIW